MRHLKACIKRQVTGVAYRKTAFSELFANDNRRKNDYLPENCIHSLLLPISCIFLCTSIPLSLTLQNSLVVYNNDYSLFYSATNVPTPPTHYPSRTRVIGFLFCRTFPENLYKHNQNACAAFGHGRYPRGIIRLRSLATHARLNAIKHRIIYHIVESVAHLIFVFVPL